MVNGRWESEIRLKALKEDFPPKTFGLARYFACWKQHYRIVLVHTAPTCSLKEKLDNGI